MAEKPSSIQPCTDAGQASAEAGIVLLDGPDGVAVAMTPDAARRTAENLHRAALEAETQGTGGVGAPSIT